MNYKKSSYNCILFSGSDKERADTFDDTESSITSVSQIGRRNKHHHHQQQHNRRSAAAAAGGGPNGAGQYLPTNSRIVDKMINI